MKRVAIGLSVLAVVGAACGGGDGGGGETISALTMVDNEFQPSEFTAAGDSLSVTNEGQALHSFTVPDGGIDEDVAAGESTDIDLSGLEAGTFDLQCKYHPEMTGSITIQ